jgi:hypothetical protein
VALDCLGHEPVVADALQQNLPRDLALAEPRDLDALREVVGRVLDGVVDVVRRNLDGQPDAVRRQLLDLGLHVIIQAGASGARSNVGHVSAWNLSLLGLAGAIWLTIFTAMAYAVRVRA